MKMPERIDPAMFAPCGMNCMVCYKHCYGKNPCAGCLAGEDGKPEHCRNCAVKDCVKERGHTYCHECQAFPCQRIRNLDRSYRKRYGVSLTAFSRTVRERGMEAFLGGQRWEYTCPRCGGVISLHDRACGECGGEKDAVTLRPYAPEDLPALTALFYDTVHAVNAADYTPAQLDAWADGSPDLERWGASLAAHDALVAVEGEAVAGFADMDASGYLDRLYVHKDRQRRGIASALCGALERMAAARGAARLTTHASRTARPFFEKRGFRVVREQQVERHGVALVNFFMEKPLR